jgi:hypothetical protein
MEIQMVLMRVYKNFSIELTHQEPLEFIPLVTLKPKHAIQLRIKKI